MSAFNPEQLRQLGTIVAMAVKEYKNDNENNNRYDNKKWHEEVSKQTDIFDSDGFVDWQFRLRNLILTYAGKETLTTLDKASKIEKEILEAEFPEDSKELYVNLSSRLYNILATKTKGEASLLIRNVPEMNGLEAYRRLCHKFDSKTIGKRMTLIRKLVSPPKVKQLKDVGKTIETWEETMRILINEYQEDISPGLKIGIILEMVPHQLTETVIPMLPDPKKDDNAYQKTKELLLQMVEHKTEFQKPTPMDVGAVQEHEDQQDQEDNKAWMDDLNAFHQKGETKGEGKNKGKGKGKGIWCWHCGEPGHRKLECPYYRPADNGKGWQAGGWSQGGKEKGGKGWQGKNQGKNQYGNWGTPNWTTNQNSWDQNGKGEKPGAGRIGTEKGRPTA